MNSFFSRPLWSLCLVCLLPATTFAYSSGGYGGNSLLGGGGGGGYGGGGGSYGGGGGEGKGPITAAVETHRSVEVKPVQMVSEPHEPQVIEVPSDDMPVTVHFKSQSSRVNIQQTHTPAQINEPEHTSSEDEPQRVIHEVVKPVIQEIREIIQPYRRLIQQIQPVIEQTHTVIAKGEPRQAVQPLSVAGATGGNSLGGSLGGSSSGGSLSGGSGGGYASAASTVSLKSAPTTSSEGQYRQVSSAASAAPSSHSTGSNGGRKQLSIQQLFQQASQAQSTYSSRRGDFLPTQTKITLRPAPMNYNAYQAPTVSMPMVQPVYSGFDYKGAISSLHDEDLPLLTFVAKPIRFRARARA